jgi:hypothetical protein
VVHLLSCGLSDVNFLCLGKRRECIALLIELEDSATLMQKSIIRHILRCRANPDSLPAPVSLQMTTVLSRIGWWLSKGPDLYRRGTGLASQLGHWQTWTILRGFPQLFLANSGIVPISRPRWPVTEVQYTVVSFGAGQPYNWCYMEWI